MIRSPFGHRRTKVLLSVEELKPAKRDICDNVDPLLRIAAMISAGC